MKEEKIKSVSTLDVNIVLSLTESEARALDAIVGYGTESFLEVFYPKLGKAYLEPHESGLISLFETIKKELPKHLGKADDVRGVWNGSKVAMLKARDDKR